MASRSLVRAPEGSDIDTSGGSSHPDDHASDNFPVTGGDDDSDDTSGSGIPAWLDNDSSASDQYSENSGDGDSFFDYMDGYLEEEIQQQMQEELEKELDEHLQQQLDKQFDDYLEKARDDESRRLQQEHDLNELSNLLENSNVPPLSESQTGLVTGRKTTIVDVEAEIEKVVQRYLATNLDENAGLDYTDGGALN